MMPRNVVVTGSSGFIGHHLVQRLREARVTVIGVDLKEPPVDAVPNGFIKADVADPDWIDQVSRLFPPKRGAVSIVHLAAEVSVASDPARAPHYVRTNTRGAIICADAANKFNGRCVLASSGAVQALEKAQGCTGPAFNLYAATKQAAEDAIWRIASWPIILRFSNVYGPMWKTKGVVGKFTEALLTGSSPKVGGVGDQQRDFIFVGDIADGIIMALWDTKRGTYHLGTGIRTSINVLLKQLRVLTSTAGKDKKRNGLPTVHSGSLPVGVESNWLDPDLPGWMPRVALEQGLKQTVRGWKV